MNREARAWVPVSIRMVVHAALLLGWTHCSAVDSFRPFRCGYRAIGVRILDNNGKELRRVCTQGWRLESQTGFVKITNDRTPDLLVVAQAGAKVSEATLYRNTGRTYVRVGWWSGWDIQPGHWRGKPAIHYEMLEPTLEHPKHVIFFLWNGARFVPSEPGKYSYSPYCRRLLLPCGRRLC